MAFSEFNLTDRHFFINNCLGAFFRGTLNWFGDVFYPRIQYKVIGTYEKSVEYFNKKRQLSREVDKNLLPSITLDPNLDFKPAEVGGRFLWQSESLAPGFGSYLFDRIPGLEDQGICLTPVFSKYEGDFNLTFWFNSIYEYFDIRLFLFQWSGGYDRKLRPVNYESFIVLPDSINEYELDGVPLDWSKTERTLTRIDNMGKEVYTLPVKLTPWFWFTDISDASTKFGGDDIAEYKLSVSVRYEIDLPTYLVLTPYCGDIKIRMTFSMDTTYSRYGMLPFFSDDSYRKTAEHDVPGIMIIENEVNSKNRDIILADFDKRSYYQFTKKDEDDWTPEQEWFTISNPFKTVLNPEELRIVTYSGMLDYGDEWTLNPDGSTIEVKVEPKEGELIEVFKYLLT